MLLQQERAAAAAVAGSRAGRTVQQLRTAEAATDAALAVFRAKSLPAAEDLLGRPARQLLGDLDRQYRSVDALRAKVHARTVSPVDAIRQYDSLCDSTTRIFGSLVQADDAEIFQTTTALVNAWRARDYALREDALLTASESQGGRMSAAEYAAFVQAVGNRRQVTEIAATSLSDDVDKRIQPLLETPQYARYQVLENSIVASSSRTVPAETLQEWRSTSRSITAAWGQAQLSASEALTDRTDTVGKQTVVRLAIVGGLGLMVVAASILLSVRFARRLSGELHGLQRAAQHLAENQLPQVIARLRKGEEVKPPSEVSRFSTGRTREVAQVADAFTKVQSTAIQAAVAEAGLRKGISRVFINLAWRSQSLLHRQLSMLDSMERRTSDPDVLEDLFRLDHLTTRMRRHAEGLVILSGSATIRGWDEPVPVDDLLRAALAEVEDYPRVEVVTDCTASVTGSIVADVIHLIAELIENATAFSPPNTEVSVKAALVANGLAVEIVDRGVGLDAEELVALNQQLTDPPEFDLADSDRLGLFVVARLAARHGIRVVLQASAYAGVTAVVVLPMSLVVLEGGPPSTSRATRIPQRLTSSAPDPLPAEKPITHTPPMQQLTARPTWEDDDNSFEAPSAGPVPSPLEDDDTDGLPRRIRQNHLAPQLRGSAVRGHGRHALRPAQDDEVEEHRHESSRDMLSSLQAGWTAGRGAEDDDMDTGGHRLPAFDERLHQGES
ncbi:sensor histidine kinase [Actinomadura rudentiformis]|uniref:sensor histidine kinase n=1 Tax=Actinomadura rudentiformis TaxID=359158 RepID=UPI00178C41D9|nr:nitrate- and nitrite sensing domain-containing protein [Actinomadura rudentiformis]